MEEAAFTVAAPFMEEAPFMEAAFTEAGSMSEATGAAGLTPGAGYTAGPFMATTAGIRTIRHGYQVTGRKSAHPNIASRCGYRDTGGAGKGKIAPVYDKAEGQCMVLIKRVPL
jgi:hypothetical protein